MVAVPIFLKKESKMEKDKLKQLIIEHKERFLAKANLVKREVQKEIIGEEPELLEAAKYGARAGGTLSYYDELLEDAEREEYLKEQES